MDHHDVVIWCKFGIGYKPIDNFTIEVDVVIWCKFGIGYKPGGGTMACTPLWFDVNLE